MKYINVYEVKNGKKNKVFSIGFVGELDENVLLQQGYSFEVEGDENKKEAN